MSQPYAVKFSIQFSLFILSSLVFLQSQAGTWRPEGVVGGKLYTHIYVPNTAPVINGRRALMVSMHGCGQTNSDFKQGANWPSTADAYGMVVALPQASGEGLYGGLLECWNFHVGMSASRSQTDARYLLDLVEELLADVSLNLDPQQVYITGLSSGGGMVNQMACLAPDVFAGAGVNAGPAPGSSGTDLSRPGISIPVGKDNCESLAGPFIADLYTQVYNNVHGSQDSLVGPEHAERNTGIFIDVYEGDGVSDITACGSSTLTGGGDVTTYCDGLGPRISKVMVNGMGHAWPAGPGSSGGGSYIDHTHINYPDYITAFFFESNRRMSVVIPTATPSPTPSPTLSPTPSPTLSPTPSPTLSPTPSPTLSPTPSPTHSPTPTVTPSPTPTTPDNCTEITTYNYYHKVSQRAYGLGSFLTPDYFAMGSDDPMQGSTWGLTTLHTVDNGNKWNVGDCP
ncbi:MAG: PHB depolymerase family esterase [Agarilytica sp.]